jgi:hypothetical protein
MLNFMLIHTPENNKQKRFSISRDSDDKRVATSLEERGIIKVCRDFECWTVRFASDEVHDAAFARSRVEKPKLVFCPPILAT